MVLGTAGYRTGGKISGLKYSEPVVFSPDPVFHENAGASAQVLPIFLLKKAG